MCVCVCVRLCDMKWIPLYSNNVKYSHKQKQANVCQENEWQSLQSLNIIGKHTARQSIYLGTIN